MPSALDDLRELTRQDARLARDTSRLGELDSTVAAIRERAESIAAFFANREAEDERLRVLEAETEEELDRRRGLLADADERLAAAQSDEERELLRRGSARAADRVEGAERHLEQVHELQAALRRSEQELSVELPQLEARAHVLATKFPDVAAPSSEDGLVTWASRAHTALFVAVSQHEAQWERVIREANELASTLLGEPTYGSTPAQTLARVERSSLDERAAAQGSQRT